MVFVAPKDYPFKNNPTYNSIKNIVHPVLLKDKIDEIIRFHHAKRKPAFYLKLFLKSIARSLGIKK